MATRVRPAVAAIDALDHLILAAASLAEGIAYVRGELGVDPLRVGRNPGAGTDHARVALGPRRYLEILAPAPGEELSPPLAPIRALTRPTLWSWALATDAGHGARAEALGVANVPARSDVPEGGYVRWRNLAVTIALGAAAPVFIEWSEGAPHPADAAPQAGQVRTLTVLHPDPDAARAALARAGFTVDVVPANTPSLRAEIVTRAGAVHVLS